jgi:hypothetical protein
MTTDHTLRDGMIHNAREARHADETKILQKVNAANREAFVQRMPGQLEHVMRLVMERLQHCLHKTPDTVLDSPDTWPAAPAEISALANSLWHLEQVRQHWPMNLER